MAIADGQINVTMNARGVDTEIARLQRNIDNFGARVSSSGRKASDGVDNIGRGAKNAAKEVDTATTRMAQSILKQTVALQSGGRQAAEYYRQMAQLRGLNADFLEPYINQLDKAQAKNKSFIDTIGGVRAAYAGFAAFVATSGIRQLASMSDAYTVLNAKLLNASGTQEAYRANFAATIDIARRAQAPLAAVADLNAGLTRSLKDQNVEQSKVNAITLNVALALKAMGADASQTGSVITQLSQAFASGVLRGDEFNSMSENAPLLQAALAKSLGVTIGELRQMAQDGELTADKLVKAFGDGELTQSLQKQADNTNTLSGSWTNLSNAVIKKIGEIDKAWKASDFFQDILGGLAGVIDGDFAPDGSLIKAIQDFSKSNQGNFNNILDSIRPQQASLLWGAYKNRGAINAGLYNLFGRQTDAQIEQARRLASTAMFGGVNPITSGLNNYAPNFSASNSVVNVDEVHKRQEEAAQRQRELDKKTSAERKKLHDAEVLRQKGALEMYWELETRRWVSQADSIAERFKLEDKLAKEDYERKQKYLEMLGKQAEENYKAAQDEVKRQADEMQRQYERTQDILTRTILDSLNEGFGQQGLSIAENFIQTLKNMFKSVVLEPVIRYAINASGLTSLMTGVSNVFSPNASAADGLIATQNSSIFERITDGFKSINTTFASSIENLGVFLSTGNGGLGDTIGGFLGQYSNQIASGIGYLSSAYMLSQGNIAGAALTAAGTYFLGPIGGAIGGALGSLFGGKEPPMVGSQSRGTYTGGAYTGTFGQYGSKDIGAGKSLNEINKAYATSLGNLLGEFGLNDTVSARSIYRQRTNVKGFFGAEFDGGKFYEYLGKGISFEKFANTVLGPKLVKAIEMSKLPESIKDLFDGISDKTQVQNMIAAASGLSDSQQSLIDYYNLTAERAAAVAKASGLAGDSLAAFVVSLTNASLSQQSAASVLLKERADLTELTGAVPTTLKAFDAWLKTIDTTTAEGQKKFADQFSARDRVSSLTSAFDAITTARDNAKFSLLSQSEQMAISQQKLAEAFAEVNAEVPGSRDELVKWINGLDMTTEAGLKAAMAVPALVDAFQQIEENANSTTNALREMSRFTNLADYRFYKGVANNYGNQVANDYMRASGAIQTSTSGKPTINGADVDVLTELKAMRQASQEQSSVLNRILRMGLKVQA
ncbi:tape measure protein [Methylophilus sp.]|uniref:tape measure protein n=1 Tax=Methylophilus sp. TaxID=29541 RepID=UPI000D416DCF|nr:tape measure protein [Methylophilus sp.]PPD12169.1 MAG: hypothetical protein CTY26_06145 [Methylophilus sp.]